MRYGAGGLALILAGTLSFGAGCLRKGSDAPTNEAVTALLRQEADALKRDGEKLDPVLRMKATWSIAGIDVTERADDAERPWAGTIRFKIRSEMRDERGAIVAEEFDRRFDYVYVTSLKRWVFQLPPSPRPE